jgi:GNAT superfamily N-acetyltransferase
MNVRPLRDADRGWVAQLMRTRWGSEIAVAHGVVFEPATLDGFVAWDEERRIGLLTYHLDAGCEIVTIDSLEEGRGVGTALLEAVEAAARATGRRFVWLITTNDNEHARDWYLRRGFEVVAVHEGAVDRSREVKPEIPSVNAENGLPIRDEIEMRRSLG